MVPEPAQRLRKTFCAVLERQFYLFAEEIDPEEVDPSLDEGVEAAITFSAPIEGALRLMVPTPLGIELAVNALGMNAGDDDAMDAAKAALRVTCEQFLAPLIKAGGACIIAPPFARRLETGDWAVFQQRRDVVAVLVGDWPALLELLGPEREPPASTEAEA